VGTNRIPYQTTDLEIWQEALVQGKQNEEALLQLAGAHAIARRAGYVPKKTKVTLPETAEEEELEYVFAGANQYFKNDDIASFNLFISELVRNKRIIQPLLLPQLFETATRFRSDPETIMQVAGKRGQWFLQFYPKAAYFKDVMEVDWETGTLKNRLRFAQKLRQTDPNKARELIEAVISELAPMRERAEEFEQDRQLVRDIISNGSEAARDVARETLDDVVEAMRFARP